MVILERTGSRGDASAGVGEAGDRFVRFRQILRLHHAHPPAMREVQQLEERHSPDDCLILTQQNIAQFHLAQPLRWTRYSDIERAFTARRRAGTGGHSVPYSRDEVFAPLKMVLAEADQPIRAALVDQPAYPWQSKMATPLHGARLWMVYAALAVLNSKLGQGFYRTLLRERPSRSRKPHGLKAHAINPIPIARVDWEFDELGLVAYLAHQMTALHQARSALSEALGAFQHPAERWVLDAGHRYTGVFAAQTRAVSQRLDDALRRLLGLTEGEEHLLLEEARPPDSRSDVQPRLIEQWDLLPPPPPPPPVILATGPDANVRAIPPEAGNQLRFLLEHWQGIVNRRPPRELGVQNRPRTLSLTAEEKIALLRSLAMDCGVSLSDEAVSSDGIYG